MERICKTCHKPFILNLHKQKRSQIFCSRKCIRNATQFKKGHKMRVGIKPSRKAWDNHNSKKTRFGVGQESFFKKGLIPWNKGRDFGGDEILAKRISSLSLYREWKKSIKKRDENQCILCLSRESLHVHHSPKSLAQIIRECNVHKPQEAKAHPEFWDINNGRTLCLKCHKQTETYGKNFVQKV